MSYKTIFLVDDNPTTTFYNQDVISEFSSDSEIISFENPNDFIDTYLSNFSGHTDAILLLLDINMPQKLGYEVLEELEERIDDLDNLHVLMVTSSNLRSDLEKSSKFLSVVGYIEKPLTLEKLTKALNGDY
jgi:response regulator RpfG family c-di-GMP phosphodiesterase